MLTDLWKKEKGKRAHIMHILHKDENDIINYLDIM